MTNTTKLQDKIESLEYQMTESRFWEIVNHLNWADVSQTKYDSDSLRLEVINTFGLDYLDVVELRNIYYLAWEEMDKKIGQRNPAGGGDDSHNDLIAHIIGLGKEEFYSCLDDYSLIEARGKATYGSPKGYRESFSYIFPYSEDSENPKDDIEWTAYIDSIRELAHGVEQSETKNMKFTHKDRMMCLDAALVAVEGCKFPSNIQSAINDIQNFLDKEDFGYPIFGDYIKAQKEAIKKLVDNPQVFG